MLKKCQLCQRPLYEKTPEGIKIKLENHSEIYAEGIIKITCSCGYETFTKEEA